MRCNKCLSTSIHYDSTRGDSVCTNCGIVLEENAVVSDITFDNTKVVGMFIGENHHGIILFTKADSKTFMVILYATLGSSGSIKPIRRFKG